MLISGVLKLPGFFLKKDCEHLYFSVNCNVVQSFNYFGTLSAGVNYESEF